MNEIGRGERSFKPSAEKKPGKTARRVITTGAFIAGITLGAIADKVAGGALSENIMKPVKAVAGKVAETEGDFLDRNNSITQGQVDQIRQNLQQRAVKDQAEGVTTGLKPTK